MWPCKDLIAGIWISEDRPPPASYDIVSALSSLLVNSRIEFQTISAELQIDSKPSGWLASQEKSCDLVEIKVKHDLGNVGILDKPELHAYRLSKFLRISFNYFLSISKYIRLHIILYLTNSATDHLSKFKLQPISLPTQLHDRDSVYAHQLYLNCIIDTFIRLFQLPTIHHHLNLLYRCFCF